MRIRRRLALTTALASFALLGGCALPASVSIASWVADGVSYLATDKSLTDHGISWVMDEDCALHRIITDNGNVCYPEDDAVTTVAEADSETGAGGLAAGDEGSAQATQDALIEAGAFQLAAADGPETVPGADDLASFETAAGDATATVEAEGGLFAGETDLPGGALEAVDDSGLADLNPGVPQAAPVEPVTVAHAPAAEPAASPIVFAMTSRVPVQTAARGTTIAAAIMADAQAPIAALAKPETQEAALPVAGDETVTVSVGTDAGTAMGRYFVIGSFRGRDNAQRMARRHAEFAAHVIQSESGSLYRVVVGPVPEAAEKRAARLLAAAGLIDVWTLVVGGEQPVVEVAQLGG